MIFAKVLITLLFFPFLNSQQHFILTVTPLRFISQRDRGKQSEFTVRIDFEFHVFKPNLSAAIRGCLLRLLYIWLAGQLTMNVFSKRC